MKAATNNYQQFFFTEEERKEEYIYDRMTMTVSPVKEIAKVSIDERWLLNEHLLVISHLCLSAAHTASKMQI